MSHPSGGEEIILKDQKSERIKETLLIRKRGSGQMGNLVLSLIGESAMVMLSSFGMEDSLAGVKPLDLFTKIVPCITEEKLLNTKHNHARTRTHTHTP